jgi:glutathione synthase/RimK-type ligase-like ATP-grasp enzyme
MQALAAQVGESLRSLQHEGESFELDSYFGIDPAGRHPGLARHLFSLLGAPLLRARFDRCQGRWQVAQARAIDLAELTGAARAAVPGALEAYATGRPARAPRAAREPALAILHDAREPEPPSDRAALERFVAAAGRLGMRTAILDRNDIGRLEEFDALFIRDTTRVGHYTYQFSSRAQSLGLVVIDDPDSIVQCNNKVFLHELLSRHGVPVPKTVMVHRDNIEAVAPALGLPCILKEPDSAFSLGVGKVETAAELRARALRLLEKSELIVAQQWLPTTFDWRVGVLDRRPLYVCKYFMAPGHWQVIKRESFGRVEGQTVAVTVGEAPRVVIDTAWRAANLIGDGLYGVDLKQVGEQCFVMEINDNPSIDAGNEDGVLQDSLYREVMGVLHRRICERRPAPAA